MRVCVVKNCTQLKKHGLNSVDIRKWKNIKIENKDNIYVYLKLFTKIKKNMYFI